MKVYMLNISKSDVTVKSNLDFINMMNTIADEVTDLVTASFWGNGTISDVHAVRNLHAINGRMCAIKAMIANIN